MIFEKTPFADLSPPILGSRRFSLGTHDCWRVLWWLLWRLFDASSSIYERFDNFYHDSYETRRPGGLGASGGGLAPALLESRGIDEVNRIIPHINVRIDIDP